MADIVLVDPDTGMPLDTIERFVRYGISQFYVTEEEDGMNCLVGSRDPRIHSLVRQCTTPREYGNMLNARRNRAKRPDDRVVARFAVERLEFVDGAAAYSLDGNGIAFEAALELDGDTVRATLRRASFDLRHGHRVVRARLVVFGPMGRLAAFDFDLVHEIATHPKLEERTVPFRTYPDGWSAYLHAFGEQPTTA